MIDVIWPGIMAPHAVDLNKTLREHAAQHFEAIVKNNTVKEKLVGVPWYTDAGLLYYRTDLLKKYGYEKPPETWAQLQEMAKKVQDGERAAGNPDFWGFVWQGAAYEGLTCDALEWQVSNGGGNIIEPDGNITVNNPQTIAAFERAKGWINTISPPGVTTYKEEDARNVWQGGNAAFMRNWPYAYAAGQGADSKIKDKFDVTSLPKGDGDKARNAATLGGWQMMANSYSTKQEAAVEWVKFLTHKDVEKSRAIERSNLPTIASLYDDPDVLKANPFYARLKPVFQGGAVPRPSTVSADLYNDVSVAYFTNVNQILTGQKDAKTAVAAIETELKRIMR
jgi:trehalose/maltose transport system substrate-binding protein